MSLFNSVTLLRISGLSAFFSVPTYSAHQRTRCVSILNWEKRNRAGYLQCLHVGSGEFKCPLHWQRVEGGHSLTLYLQVQPVREHNVAQNIEKVSLKTCLCLMQGMKCPFFLQNPKCDLRENSKWHIPISVVFFESWESIQWIIKL